MTRQDIDLQKIQVLESGYQGWFNFKASLVAGIIVGTIILIATIQYQNIFNIYAIAVGYTILIVGGILLISDMQKTHEEHIRFINGLMLRVEKDEKLESIEELRKIHRKSAKTKKQEQKSSVLSLDEKERLDAGIARANEIEKRFNLSKKKVKVRAIVKLLVLFVGVGLLVLTIISGLQNSSYNLLDSILYAVLFLIVIAISSLDTLSEWAKEEENLKSEILLEKHRDDILRLEEKYRELDRKYNELLKENKKQ